MMPRAAWVGLVALMSVSCYRPIHRVDDRVGALDKNDVAAFERYLADLERESGIDVRLVFVDSLAGETLEQFAVRTARDLGIGRDLDRHGVLFAYDVRDQRLRIEVGPMLQGVFPDGFVGYLMRGNAHSLFASRTPSLGLRITLFMLHARLRRAALGNEYDPRAVQFIEDRRRLATGGGASVAMGAAGAPGLVNRPATESERGLFRPQPTVAAAYQRYLDWLGQGGAAVDVDLFTPATRDYLTRLPMSPIFHDYILFMEYGRAYEILERGDLAMLYFTDDPLISPHFLRRTPGGWQMDLFADVRDTHEYIGGPWTWSMMERDDDVTRTFFDRYTALGPILRVAGGDNRTIPIGLAEMPRWPSQPGASQPPGVEQLTVKEAAERIARVSGRPAVVVLYWTWGDSSEQRFPAIVQFARRCQGTGAEVLAFSVDENWNAVRELPGFLRRHNAPFDPVHIYHWPKGMLTGLMAPLGIRVGASWSPPLVAVLDRDGRVIVQSEGAVPVSGCP